VEIYYWPSRGARLYLREDVVNQDQRLRKGIKDWE